MPTQTITYGTFTFPFVKLGVNQETVYSPNRIDVMGTAYTFSISGWLTADTFNGLNALVSLLRGTLTKPRQSFSVTWNEGSDTATLYNFAATDDIEWGPQPSNVVVGPFLGGRAAMYACQIRVIVKECYTCDSSSCTPGTRPSNVLSITRRFSHAIDLNGQTTRTVTGELIVTSTGQDADYYRTLVSIPLPTWFKRESFNFTQSEDGLRFSYSIVDREMAWTLPKPITGGDATYTVRTTSGLSLGGNAGAMRQQYTLSGEFSAPVNVLSSDIITQVMQLAADKFPFNSGVTLIPTDREFSEVIFTSNTIRFSLSCESAAGSTTAFDPRTGLPTFGAKPTNTTGQSMLIGVYGGDGQTINSGVIAPKPVIYDACVTPTGPGSPSQIPSGGGTDYQQTQAGPTGETSAYDNALASQSHLDSPYYEVSERIVWEIDNGYESYYPKVVGQNPVFQRVRPPSVRIFQVGYVSRDVLDDQYVPQPATPIYDSSQAKVLRSIVDTEMPVPIGTSGWQRFTTYYGYVLEWASTFLKNNNSDPTQNNNPGVSSLGIGFEQDPRIASSGPQRLIQLTVPEQMLDTTQPAQPNP